MRVPQRIALVSIAVVIAAGIVVGRAITLSGAPAPAFSHKTSHCGPVGLPARDLGLERARSLTLCLLNDERARAGLAALQGEPRLELASQRHSEDMMRRGYFEHESPEQVDPQGRMLAAGYPANNAFTGENIARGEGAESSPVEIVDSWMHSPPHRENVLRGAFIVIGIGVATGGQTAVYTTD